MFSINQERAELQLRQRPDGIVNYNEIAQPDGKTDYHNLALISPVSIKEKIDVSIVIPLLNEVENLELLYSQLRDLFNGWDRKCELILVDDGSTDGSFEILRRLQAGDDRIRVIRLRRNFGQTAAFSAGFDLARGDVIITMDGDLQNDPADIPKLLGKIEEGYDVVSGWRQDRWKEGVKSLLTRRIPSAMANWLISKVTGVELHDYGCSLKAYRHDIVENIRLYGEMHRFIPALASWMGVQVAEIPVNHAPRKFGRSKYGLGRIIRVILDLLTVKFLLDYATRPIQIFGLLGVLSLCSGITLAVYLSVLRLYYYQPLSDRPLLLLAVLLVILGVQLIIMGLLGELVVRTYHETQGKPIYMVREMLDSRIIEDRRKQE
jgi:glycosyltransferase involved in cell wall biosynthesis